MIGYCIMVVGFYLTSANLVFPYFNQMSEKKSNKCNKHAMSG